MRLLRLLISFVSSAAIAYLTSEVHMWWYVNDRGISRSELGEDYGFAFDNLLVTFFSFVVAFIGLIVYLRKRKK